LNILINEYMCINFKLEVDATYNFLDIEASVKMLTVKLMDRQTDADIFNT